MAQVELKHVDKTYPNGCHAVRDVCVDIADGELVVLLGPSGSGKSTLLRMIAGLDQPTRGEIAIGSRTVNRVAPADRDVAMVFQDYALYPHMSVAQNLEFGLKMRRTPRAEIARRVMEAAEILSIKPLLARRPRELSGGERQRVALGRAIVRQPQVFLFDEPLSNLDALLRAQMRSEIAQLHQRLRATILHVTHDQAEAMTLGQRIVLMDQGVVQQVDTPLNVYRRPANRFVASFLGNPPMNFLAGHVQAGLFQIAGTLGDGAALQVDGQLPEGPAVLGVRPEDLLPAHGDVSLGPVRLQAVERMGHETIVHFQLAGARHAARLPADADVRPGGEIRLSIRPGALHLFDEEGRRLN